MKKYLKNLKSTCKNISEIIKDITLSDNEFKKRLKNAKKTRYKSFTHKLKDDNGQNMYFLKKEGIRVYLVERCCYGKKKTYINFHKGNISCTNQRILGIDVSEINFNSISEVLKKHYEELNVHGQYVKRNNLQKIRNSEF